MPLSTLARRLIYIAQLTVKPAVVEAALAVRVVHALMFYRDAVEQLAVLVAPVSM
ncbi:MAG: hypothetical protein LBO67_06500 [Spirochaetaceae bacterium]|nr:hypothetical protein [Spirochaetaceae bacterium]